MTRMSKTERIARDGLMRNLIELQRDAWITETVAEEVPDAWHTLESDMDVAEKKENVTLYLERSVIRFYRAMGNGYQARINRLLATWAQMKIADVLDVETFLKKRVGWKDMTPAERRQAALETDEELQEMVDEHIKKKQADLQEWAMAGFDDDDD